MTRRGRGVMEKRKGKLGGRGTQGKEGGGGKMTGFQKREGREVHPDQWAEGRK